MRNISFQLTTEQIRNQTKTVTRRLGWLKLKVGDRLQGCVKCMGLKKGEPIQKLAVIEVVKVERQELAWICDEPYGDDEVIKEGFPDLSPQQFVEMFCKHMKCEPRAPVTRIEFKYISPTKGADDAK